MIDRPDAMRAMLTDDWQSTAEIVGRMMAAGFYPCRQTALADVYSKYTWESSTESAKSGSSHVRSRHCGGGKHDA